MAHCYARYTSCPGLELLQSGTKAVMDGIRLCILQTTFFDGGDAGSRGIMLLFLTDRNNVMSQLRLLRFS
jgi:hypothetical protein